MHKHTEVNRLSFTLHFFYKTEVGSGIKTKKGDPLSKERYAPVFRSEISASFAVIRNKYTFLNNYTDSVWQSDRWGFETTSTH